ncbi:apelin receptor early endogenous ligand isoform X1 [Zonotrichia albicollis]|uniref:apelin receptor early endogenous ligand isoform X1 n=1 Tax=Zonotrichia albicollis TaxID=44394 RepID=UPI003D810F11
MLVACAGQGARGLCLPRAPPACPSHTRFVTSGTGLYLAHPSVRFIPTSGGSRRGCFAYPRSLATLREAGRQPGAAQEAAPARLLAPALHAAPLQGALPLSPASNFILDFPVF